MFLEIDGSEGEGGGQILRSSLSMSAILGKPILIKNIRAGRREPGLQAQHLTCVRAIAEITSAELDGDVLGSQELTFIPKKPKPGKYFFDVAKVKPSAGSVSLVLQTILMPLALSGDTSVVVIKGGTHVPLSPSVTYLQKVYLPIVMKFGLVANIKLSKWGWYPKGNGEIDIEIHPANLQGIDLLERGELRDTEVISVVSNLPISIAERQRNSALMILKANNIKAISELHNAPSIGQGTSVFVLLNFEKSKAGFESLGEKGKRAEQVAREACEQCINFLNTDACIDEHLADQLITIMALSKGTSCFKTSKITRHLLTNISIAEKFLPIKFKVLGKEGQHGEVHVEGYEFKN